MSYKDDELERIRGVFNEVAKPLSGFPESYPAICKIVNAFYQKDKGYYANKSADMPKEYSHGGLISIINDAFIMLGIGRHDSVELMFDNLISFLKLNEVVASEGDIYALLGAYQNENVAIKTAIINIVATNIVNSHSECTGLHTDKNKDKRGRGNHKLHDEGISLINRFISEKPTITNYEIEKILRGHFESKGVRPPAKNTVFKWCKEIKQSG
ncbi:MAG: hypothetical protein EKE20_14395 [Candidatus Symbiopectobacterium sp. Dall1.0]|nr:hypothetical protein [Candidatus Symbiopectobacterium sp. Dall1.0]